MRNTLKTECLVQALENVVEAKQEHDKARDEYDSPSWGYYGHHFVKRMEDAAEDFEKRLDDYIEKKVQEALGKLSND